jgi:thiamine biosynthesis protein ThiS
VKTTHEPIDIVVNGEPKQIAAGASLEDLVRSLDLDPRMVVVEHNRAIVRRGSLASVSLTQGDSVELVHFVGGG